jgi:hypothetical protein
LNELQVQYGLPRDQNKEDAIKSLRDLFDGEIDSTTREETLRKMVENDTRVSKFKTAHYFEYMVGTGAGG